MINAEGVEGTPATHLPIDAIQEFNVQSSPEADYGWKPGAIINIGIKSGTTHFTARPTTSTAIARWTHATGSIPAPIPWPL